MSTPLLSDDAEVFRGIRASQVQDGQVLFTAFLLSQRDSETVPPGLSVSLHARNAFLSLKRLAGVAALRVGRVRALTDSAGSPLGLDVLPQPHTEDPGYAWLTGLPLYAEEGTAERSRAVAVANRLAALSVFRTGEPLP
jgi:hypothetical protein